MIVPEHPERATGPIELELSEADEVHGNGIGAARQRYGRQHGMVNVNDEVAVLDPLTVDCIGARCEVALCRCYGLPLELVRADGNLHEPDVAGVEVRGTNGGDRRLLVYPRSKLRPGDVLSRPYVLVWALGARRYVVRGWAWGWQVMVQQYWNPPSCTCACRPGRCRRTGSPTPRGCAARCAW